jgi:hypothetical protein
MLLFISKHSSPFKSHLTPYFFLQTPLPSDLLSSICSPKSPFFFASLLFRKISMLHVPVSAIFVLEFIHRHLNVSLKSLKNHCVPNDESSFVAGLKKTLILLDPVNRVIPDHTVPSTNLMYVYFSMKTKKRCIVIVCFRWWRHWVAVVTWCDVISTMTLHWDKLSPGEFQQLQDFAACKCLLWRPNTVDCTSSGGGLTVV